ncbi:hypothetical protein BOTCAL_0035g00250 [Botryotinia calthae]|uniref:Major facilitator superfamily (MFS) profile domain-containing protein n=1 Tax=Botryotinia calthae TaxID=38488 RepID=A0A4Y8DCR2_9HELO|nr:hypothetical protein BOTCAL_0035g00250 [Botryotinia calthae]
MGVMYGYLYLPFTTFTVVFEETYRFSSGLVRLTYLGLGIGSMVGLVFFGYFSDRMMKKSTAKSNARAAEAGQEPPVDAFTIFAANSLAANTLFRSVMGALLPLAGQKMYDTLGLGWGNSLLAFLAIGMTPVPFALLKWGELIRMKYPVKSL